MAQTGYRMDDIASAFQQSPSITVALDGPDLRLVAWNTAAEQLFTPLVGGGLGASVWEMEWIAATGAFEPLRRVLESGESFSGHGWRLTVPDPSGGEHEVFLDFTYTPWRQRDGSVRGVLGTATDVTAARQRQLTAEASAASWQERFQVSRDAMTALQAALLPGSVPVIPGLQIAARYMLADTDSAAGGDWFSAYPTTSGRVALVVGDVVGHGVTASAAMGQLRAVIKERLRSGAPLSDAMGALDRHATTIKEADATTVCAALLDPRTGELEYCTAGHPPPLLVDAQGWRFLESTGAGPLRSGRGFPTRRVAVPADALLLLYSDGLIERPGTERSASLTEIGAVVSRAVAGPSLAAGAPANSADRACEESLELLTSSTGYADDITVLAVRRISPPDDLSVHLADRTGSLTAAAAEIDRWLDQLGASQSDELQLRHAVLELVTNSVEHGLADRPDGVVDLAAQLSATGEAVIDIVDNGRWRERSASAREGDVKEQFRGLGLPLAQQLVDQLSIHHDSSGTRARITHRLNRPAPIINVSVPPVPEAAARSLDEDLRLDTAGEQAGTLFVHGPLLASTAERFRTRLDVDSRAGTRPLTVNLDDVSHLTSAAVRVLQQAQRSAAAQGQRLTVTAQPGTVASQVLQLLGLPLTG